MVEKIFIFSILFSLIFTIFTTPLAKANDYGRYGLDKTVSKVEQIPKDKPNPSLASLLGQMTGIMMSTLGISFFTLMVYGGFSWMIARGDEEEVRKAKKVITSGFWGLLVILIAYAVTWFRVGGDQSMRGIFWWEDASYGTETP